MTSAAAQTRLILLHPDPAQPVRCLVVDAHAQIVARHTVPAGQPFPTLQGTRDVVAVPGEFVGLHRLRLDGRHPLQLRASARNDLGDRLAAPMATVHVALGAAAEEAQWWVAVVAHTKMRAWAERAARLALDAAAWVPDCLLLPASHAVQLGDRVLVHGPSAAFSAEAALAMAVGADDHPPVLEGEDADLRLAAGVCQPLLLNLRQFEYAPVDRRARRARRRRVALAALVALSPLLLLAAQTLRDHATAAWLRHRADHVAAAVLTGERGPDPSATLDVRYRQANAPFLLARQSSALFTAIAQQPGSQLESYEFDAGSGLRAGLVHRTPAELDALRTALQAQGIELLTQESVPVDGGLRTQINLEERR